MDSYTKTDTAELKKLVSESQKKLSDFRFAISGSKTRNVREGRGLRKKIARVKTELSKRLKVSNRD